MTGRATDAEQTFILSLITAVISLVNDSKILLVVLIAVINSGFAFDVWSTFFSLAVQ